MSKATKVKYVHREVLEEFALPEQNQTIVKVVSGRGNNLHEVVNEAGDKFLVSMPVKFRKNVWVKRGDFVVIEPIEEGDKVKAEIISILYKQQIKYIKEEGLWPNGFYDEGERRVGEEPCNDNNDEDEDDIFVNTNRVQATYEESDEEDSSCDEETESEEDESDVDNSQVKDSGLEITTIVE